MTTTIESLLVTTPDVCGGRIRIDGTRITVHRLATLFNQGQSAEEIAETYSHLSLSQVYAALGTKVTIPCLGEAPVRITVPPGTQSGTSLRLNRKGMPRIGGKSRGNLFVIVDVVTPTDLTPRQRELLEEFAKLEAKRPKN